MRKGSQAEQQFKNYRLSVQNGKKKMEYLHFIFTLDEVIYWWKKCNT
jgi:hypothetical protein